MTDYINIFYEFKKRIDKEITNIGKILGKGTYSEVREIKYKNQTVAGKVIEKKENNESEEELALEIRGENIIKIKNIYELKYKGKNYNLIIMEKALLLDLWKFNDYYLNHNLLKLIYKEPFEEKVGDNLLRLYSKQIIKALEILDRSDYCHFNINPKNLLISINIELKLSDFSLLRKLENNNITIPRGTSGYLSPEYFINNNVNRDIAKKQDYFALGSSLFKLKYGLSLLSYENYEDKKMKADRIIDLLAKKILYIKSQKDTDKDFSDFLISLIQYKPEDRPNFENIIRNKWLNKNNEELERVCMAFEDNEEKLVVELQKEDFLKKIENKIQKENKSKQIKYRFKKRKK